MVLKGGPGRAPLLLGGDQLWAWVPVYGQLPFPLSARTEATEANVMSTASDHAKTKARIFRILVTMRRAPSRRASWPGPRFRGVAQATTVRQRMGALRRVSSIYVVRG